MMVKVKNQSSGKGRRSSKDDFNPLSHMIWFMINCIIYVISILSENIRGKTNHPVDKPHTNGVEKDNSSNYEIPCTADDLDDQGSSVPRNMNNDDITVHSTKDLHEYDPLTQEPQPMTSAVCTLLTTDTSKLQEKSTMMNDKKEPTCSDKAVITTVEGDPEVVFTPIIQTDLQPQLMAFTRPSISKAFKLEELPTMKDDKKQPIATCFDEAVIATEGGEAFCTIIQADIDPQLIALTWPSTNKASKLKEQPTMTDDKQQPTCFNEAVIATKGEEAFCTIIQADIQPQPMTSDVDKAYKLQEQSMMMNDEEEPTCSGDAVIMGEDEKAVCTTEDMISPGFEDVQNDIARSVSDVGLTDYGMEAATDNIELLGYCNQFNDNVFDENITQYESMAEFETLYGQALFNVGKMEDSIFHFKKGVDHLGITVPSTKVGSAANLVFQAVKHYLHGKTSKLFQKKKPYYFDGVQYERAHCIGQLTKAYHHQQKNLLALMSSYQQLNAAEKCGDIDELMEAYASVIDCCQSYSLDYLSEHYVKKANNKTSELDNTFNNLHLLRSTMNFKLCHGDIVVASQKGKAALSIVGRHNVSLLLTTTIENLSVELLMLNTPAIKHCLDEMCHIIPKDLEDRDRITALITCANFDVFLDIGIKAEDVEDMIDTAKQYSIQKFSSGEDFYLATCLATWYARTRQWRLAKKYIAIADSKTPTSYNFMLTKALCRQAECLLLLDNSLDDKTIGKQAIKIMQKLKKKTKTCRVFAPRYMMLRSYQLLGEQKYKKAQDMLLDSISRAKRMFNYCDAFWAEFNKLNWFPERKEPYIMQKEFSFYPFL